MTGRRARLTISPTEKYALTRLEAAAFVGLTPTAFDGMVAEGLMPCPRDLRGEHRWLRPELEPKPIMGTIYFVSFRDYLKIGFTGNLANRLAALQTAIPEKLELIFSFDGPKWREQEMHELFAGARLNGEWFRLDNEVHAEIAQIRTYFE